MDEDRRPYKRQCHREGEFRTQAEEPTGSGTTGSAIGIGLVAESGNPTFYFTPADTSDVFQYQGEPEFTSHTYETSSLQPSAEPSFWNLSTPVVHVDLSSCNLQAPQITHGFSNEPWVQTVPMFDHYASSAQLPSPTFDQQELLQNNWPSSGLTTVTTTQNGEFPLQLPGVVYQSHVQCWQAPPPQKMKEIVCFGMLTTLTAQPAGELPWPGAEAFRAELQLEESGHLFFSQSGLACGQISSREVQLFELFRTEGIETDLLCMSREQHAIIQQHEKAIPIWAILYGSQAISKALGKVLHELGYYLQDPRFPSRDVKYINPQRFSNTLDTRTTDFWDLPASDDAVTVVQEEPVIPVELLESLIQESKSPMETEGSPHLLTELKSHQKQGLTFMIQREAGWRLSDPGADVWSCHHDTPGCLRYTNNVHCSSQRQRPNPFRGGILADPMGLSKTLSMISLICYDKPTEPRRNVCFSGVATLLVLPSSLLHNWEQELNKHLCQDVFHWRRHHGNSKIADFAQLGAHDIILTTYTTLAREWQSSDRKSIFSHLWQRVILDEAHEIKDPKTAKAQAVCMLKAHCRWVVTGTPIQNRLSDLFSLFRFLDLHPYSDKQAFDEHITNPWLRGEDTGALVLRRLLGYIMVRRSKASIELPSRHDLRLFLQLSHMEQQAYDLEKSKIVECLDSALASTKPQEGYRNALEKLNALRIICELGCLRKNGKLTVPVLDTAEASRSPSISPSECLTPTTLTDEDEGNDSLLNNNISSHMNECFPSGNAPVRASFLSPNPTCVSSEPFGSLTPDHWPTKIRALVEHLQECKAGTKRSTILDVASVALTTAGIKQAQIDGKVSPRKRSRIIEKFASTDDYQVLLLSLGCGAVGLTLTAASRAYLLEPQWNPSIEEQALARIHRLGQTKEVTTIRFIIDNSIEKYVLDIQNGKRDLMSILLNAKHLTHSTAMSKLQVSVPKDALRLAPELMAQQGTTSAFTLTSIRGSKGLMGLVDDTCVGWRTGLADES